MWNPLPKDTKRSRLKDIDVEEISLVGSPANERNFLIIKSQEGGETMEIKTLDELKKFTDSLVESLEAEEHKEMAKAIRSALENVKKFGDEGEPDSDKAGDDKLKEEEKKEEEKDKETEKETEKDAAIGKLTEAVTTLTKKVEELEKRRGTKQSLDGQEENEEETKKSNCKYPSLVGVVEVLKARHGY